MASFINRLTVKIRAITNVITHGIIPTFSEEIVVRKRYFSSCISSSIISGRIDYSKNEINKKNYVSPNNEKFN